MSQLVGRVPGLFSSHLLWSFFGTCVHLPRPAARNQEKPSGPTPPPAPTRLTSRRTHLIRTNRRQLTSKKNPAKINQQKKIRERIARARPSALERAVARTSRTPDPFAAALHPSPSQIHPAAAAAAASSLSSLQACRRQRSVQRSVPSPPGTYHARRGEGLVDSVRRCLANDPAAGQEECSAP